MEQKREILGSDFLNTEFSLVTTCYNENSSEVTGKIITRFKSGDRECAEHETVITSKMVNTQNKTVFSITHKPQNSISPQDLVRKTHAASRLAYYELQRYLEKHPRPQSKIRSFTKMYTVIGRRAESICKIHVTSRGDTIFTTLSSGDDIDHYDTKIRLRGVVVASPKSIFNRVFTAIIGNDSYCCW